MKREGRKINENFGSTIKYLREKRGYSLKGLEEITGISSSYINRLERGERASPSYTIIKKLADALCIDVIELLHIAERTIDNETVKSIGEIILTNNCRLVDEIATKEQKEKLVGILDKIINCQWEENIINDLAEIGKLIDEFKAIS